MKSILLMIAAFFLAANALAIPPKPLYSGGTPWEGLLEADRELSFENQTINGDRVIVDNDLDWMWVKTATKERMNWYGAFRYCDNLKYAGYSDWRLPSYWQLFSTIDIRAIKGVNTYPIFNHNERTLLWSSDDHVGIDQPDFDDRFAFYPGVGMMTFDPRDNTYSAHCVRGKKPSEVGIHDKSRYQEIKSNLVFDQRTKLYWWGPNRKGSNGDYMFTQRANFYQAIAFCDGAEEHGYSDWRLPTYHEISSIFKLDMRSPVGNFEKFPPSMLGFWTSTSHEDSGFYKTVDAFGQLLFAGPDTNQLHIACVRK